MADQHNKCSVESCVTPVRSSGAKFCEKHYMRVRRHGSTDKLSNLKDGLLVHSHGYLLAHVPKHPLAKASKRVYQHRVVFYDHHGAGPFACHWCATQVTWDAMHVDHVDADVTNNAIGNLVASCPRCNQERGLPKMRMTMKASGRLLTAHGKTMCVADWARHLGLSRGTIIGRIEKGMLIENALSPHRSKCGPARRRAPLPDHVIDVTHHSRDKQREEANGQ